MEPGEAGGERGGRDRGEGRDAPDFSDYDRAREGIERELADLARMDRVAGLSVLDQYGFAVPPGKTMLDRLRDFSGYLAQRAVSQIPGFGTVASIAVPAIIDKITGKTDQEIDSRAGRGFMDAITGGAFTMAEKLGRGAQFAAKGLGATGGPQPGFGDVPGSPGLGDVEQPSVTNFDRGQFARNPTYSDGSRVNNNPRANQLEQLLRRARMGRV